MFEITIRLHRTQTLAAEILLEDLGSVSISLEDAEDKAIFVEQVDSMPLWQSITLKALFTNNINEIDLQKKIENALGCAIEIKKQQINEQDWQKKWKQNLQAMHFGERLWVCPTFAKCPDPFAINIRLDPGLAFGTGSHATTSLCLSWLTDYSVQDKCVMDFGCGSGILAIAAYYLGARKVYAIDNDPQAIQATQMNAKNNQVDDKILDINLGAAPNPPNCDVIIANVLLSPLMDLGEKFANCVSPTGKLVLSGILEEQLVQLKKSYLPYFKFDVIHSKKEWLLIEASPS